MKEVIAALSRHGSALLGLDNVVGVGIGLKETHGKCTGRMSATVLVKRKLPEAKLGKRNIVPASLAGVSTDVLEVGELRLLERTSKHRPAPPGVSIAHVRVTAGTFGALVTDVATGEPLILSNNHVLANLSSGEDGRAKAGDYILQPGPYDGGVAADAIGTLLRFVPIRAGDGVCPLMRWLNGVANRAATGLRLKYRLRLEAISGGGNLVDAAVARPYSPEAVLPEILGLGRPTGMAEPELGMKLRKSGRTTGLTAGVVKVINATVRVGLGDVGTGVFHEQIITSNMGQPGDSGSLMVDEANRAVGLLAAGSDLVTIACRISRVCSLLGVTV